MSDTNGDTLAIFKSLADDRSRVMPVDLEDGKRLYVRRLMTDHIVAMDDAVDEKKPLPDRMKALMRVSLCDADGNLLVTDDETEAILGRIPFAPQMTIYSKALEVNGYKQVKAAGEDDAGK